MAVLHMDSEATMESTTGKSEKFIGKTLSKLIKENGDKNKVITYMKFDVEGSELYSIKNWLKTDALKNVQQLAMELHNHFIPKNKLKQIFKQNIWFMQQIWLKYGLKLVAYNPNLYFGKKPGPQSKYYMLNDVLFVKTDE